MGISYSALIAIGLDFSEQSEAKDFVLSNMKLSDEDISEIGEDFSVWLEGCGSVHGSCLDFYSGYGFYIGYPLSCRSADDFKDSFEAGVQNWEKTFPNVKYEVVKTVIVC